LLVHSDLVVGIIFIIKLYTVIQMYLSVACIGVERERDTLKVLSIISHVL
jgi:hypothetical protein